MTLGTCGRPSRLHCTVRFVVCLCTARACVLTSGGGPLRDRMTNTAWTLTHVPLRKSRTTNTWNCRRTKAAGGQHSPVLVEPESPTVVGEEAPFPHVNSLMEAAPRNPGARKLCHFPHGSKTRPFARGSKKQKVDSPPLGQSGAKNESQDRERQRGKNSRTQPWPLVWPARRMPQPPWMRL